MHEKKFKLSSLRRFLSAGAQEIFFHSAWLIFFILLCAVTYERNVALLTEELRALTAQHLRLQEEYQQATALKKELTSKVNSHSDPAWIELTLKRVLGLVAEGDTKILFITEEKEPQ